MAGHLQPVPNGAASPPAGAPTGRRPATTLSTEWGSASPFGVGGPETATGAEPGEPPAAVTATGLGRRHGDRWALHECDFTLPEGSVTALVGANGAGKTTLLHLLAGLLTPTEGTAALAKGGRVAFVAQDNPLYPHFTATDMLCFGRRANSVWDEAYARRWLDQFDVPLRRTCRTLSGGQQTQVALAVALGSCPSVLLLDEPLSALDPLARNAVMSGVLEAAAERGITVLLSTHVIAELGGVADRLLLLAAGRLALAGQVDDLLERHVYRSGPRADAPSGVGTVVRASHSAAHSRFLVRHDPGVPDASTPAPRWTSTPVPLEELVLAYLTAAEAR